MQIRNTNGLFTISIFLVLLTAFTYMVKIGVFDHVDFDTTVKLQNHIPKQFDTILSMLSVVGSAEVTTTLIVVALVLKKQIERLVTFLCYGSGLIIEIIGKSILFHPGPPHMFFRYDLGPIFPSAYVHTNYSYPSGHMYRTTFLITLLLIIIWKSSQGMRFKWLLSIILLVFFVAMFISRISLGEHWLTDVVAGMLLGGLWMIISVVGSEAAIEMMAK